MSITVLLALSLSSLAQDTKFEDSLKSVLSRSKEDTNKVSVLLEIISQEVHNRPQLVRDYINESVALSERLQWSKGKALSYRAKGIYYTQFKQYDSSLAFLRRAEKEGLATGDSSVLSYVYSSYVQHYRDQGKYAPAISYQRLVAGYQSGGPADNYAGALGNLGMLYADINDMPNALLYYHRSLEQMLKSPRQDKDTKEGTGLLVLKLGDLYLAMDQFNKAEGYYDSLVRTSRQIGSEILEGMALKGLADVWYERKNYPKAIEFYHRALETYGTDYIYYSTAAELDLSRSLNENGQQQEAQEWARKGLAASLRHQFNDFLSPAHFCLGKIYASNGAGAKAIAHFDSAVRYAQQYVNADYERDAWEQLYQRYQSAGKEGKALDAYQHFISLRDSIKSSQNENAVTRIELESGFRVARVKDSLRTAKDQELLRATIQKQNIYIWGGSIGLVLLGLLSFFVYRNFSQQRKANAIIHEEKNKSEALLRNILPEEVAMELKANGSVKAKAFEEVTVLFTDFVNFTSAGEKLSPQQLVDELHTCFKAFDEIIGKYGIEKIKTVGDAYLAVAGLPIADPDHAMKTVKAAMEINDYMARRRREQGLKILQIRIGIHSGNVVAGIVGIKKFSYDIWGDTVNTAARMEQHSEPGKINISEVTYQLIREQQPCVYRGEIAAKNKGSMKMYFVEDK